MEASPTPWALLGVRPPDLHARAEIPVPARAELDPRLPAVRQLGKNHGFVDPDALVDNLGLGFPRPARGRLERPNVLAPVCVHSHFNARLHGKAGERLGQFGHRGDSLNAYVFIEDRRLFDLQMLLHPIAVCPALATAR